MDNNATILIVGHDDIIETSLRERFESDGFKKVFLSSKISLDVLNQKDVQAFFDKEKIDYCFLASTRSGGIAANIKYPADFIYHNLESQNNVINSAFRSGIKKLMFFAGSCAYPREVSQPIKEGSLLTGPLEGTSEPYSIARIAGLKLCQALRRQYGFNAVVAIPATVYGPGNESDFETSHVISALIAKFHQAVKNQEKSIMVWGTGSPRREFLYRDDFVEACLFLMDQYDDEEIINVGCGTDVSIKELAEMIKTVSGFQGEIIFDTSKPDGTMRKLMDNSRIEKMGWRARIDLEEGVRRTYEWYTQRA